MTDFLNYLNGYLATNPSPQCFPSPLVPLLNNMDLKRDKNDHVLLLTMTKMFEYIISNHEAIATLSQKTHIEQKTEPSYPDRKMHKWQAKIETQLEKHMRKVQDKIEVQMQVFGAASCETNKLVLERIDGMKEELQATIQTEMEALQTASSERNKSVLQRIESTQKLMENNTALNLIEMDVLKEQMDTKMTTLMTLTLSSQSDQNCDAHTKMVNEFKSIQNGINALETKLMEHIKETMDIDASMSNKSNYLHAVQEHITQCMKQTTNTTAADPSLILESNRKADKCTITYQPLLEQELNVCAYASQGTNAKESTMYRPPMGIENDTHTEPMEREESKDALNDDTATMMEQIVQRLVDTALADAHQDIARDDKAILQDNQTNSDVANSSGISKHKDDRNAKDTEPFISGLVEPRCDDIEQEMKPVQCKDMNNEQSSKPPKRKIYHTARAALHALMKQMNGDTNQIKYDCSRDDIRNQWRCLCTVSLPFKKIANPLKKAAHGSKKKEAIQKASTLMIEQILKQPLPITMAIQWDDEGNFNCTSNATQIPKDSISIQLSKEDLKENADAPSQLNDTHTQLMDTKESKNVLKHTTINKTMEKIVQRLVDTVVINTHQTNSDDTNSSGISKHTEDTNTKDTEPVKPGPDKLKREDTEEEAKDTFTSTKSKTHRPPSTKPLQQPPRSKTKPHHSSFQTPNRHTTTHCEMSLAELKALRLETYDTIYVKNIPTHSLSTATLSSTEWFGWYGTVLNIQINKHVAYIRFKERQHATQALQYLRYRNISGRNKKIHHWWIRVDSILSQFLEQHKMWKNHMQCSASLGGIVQKLNVLTSDHTHSFIK
eukprot:329695_1